MKAFLAGIAARLSKMPIAQRVLLGVGVPVVSVAAALTVKRAPSTAPSGQVARAAAAPTVGGLPVVSGGSAGIPFGADLGDMFAFQSQIADIQNQIRTDRAPSQPQRMVADDRNLVRLANDAPSAAAQAAVAARTAAAAANARRGPVVATAQPTRRPTATPTPPTTRANGNVRTPDRSGPPTATAPRRSPTTLATQLREQRRKIAPRPQPPKPARKIAPRSRPPKPVRKVRPTVKRRTVGGSRIKAI